MVKNRSQLRTGFTTGSCASAAAKAAVIALTFQRPVSEVEITLPAGQQVRFEIARCEFDDAGARCCVIKDGGDDPDVTHGAEICAAVRWTEQPGISIERGAGVGLVTKPGLGLEIGSPAINPVPRKMIDYSVKEVVGDRTGRGVAVVVSVPKGVELAKKTLNPRLGIIGGISILGTTGIVRPFSTSAYKACIVQALNVAVASGCDHIVLTTGGRTEKFALRLLSLPPEAFIQMGDYAGFSLRQAAAKGIKNVSVVVMIGKLSKIAAGAFQTHASRSRVNADFLAGVSSECGINADKVEAARGSNTARHFSEMLSREEAACVYRRLCVLAATQCQDHAGNKIAVECVLVGFDGEVLGRASADG